ncbi:carbon-nitrogen hydrolase family protein [Devosia riboflavina]|uniref:carbon-nitrogen hydrolase family protein n=1 Tax=Devosia riboflavina TaxID=46914 RepID=UPI00068F2C61|nr:carbon-nitrogen hydrolase family protein [Devosia riboflavina]
MKKITVIQINSRDDKAANLAKLETLIRAAHQADHADYILTPEHSFCMTADKATMHAAAETLEDGEGLRRMADLARELNTTIHIGSILTKRDGRYYNTSVVIGPDGNQLASYDKMHRYDVDLPSGLSYRESDTNDAGDAAVTYDHNGISVGMSVCYDVRFGALYLALAARGAQVITIPAAFTFETGAAHWDTLVRARAIETQCYVAAAGQVGSFPAPGGDRANFGNSQIVDPWGKVLARCSDVEGWASASIDQAYQSRVRQNLPVARHRRAIA